MHIYFTHSQSTLDLYLRCVYFAQHLLLLRIIDLRHVSRLRPTHNEAGESERSVAATVGNGHSGRLPWLTGIICCWSVLSCTLVTLNWIKFHVGSDVGGLFQAIRQQASDGQTDEVHHARRGSCFRSDLRRLGFCCRATWIGSATFDVTWCSSSRATTWHLHDGRHVSLGSWNGE